MEERIPQPRGLQGPTATAAPVLVSSGEESSDDGEFEFEFPSVSRDDSSAGAAAPADELFADGRIRAFYPVFGRVAGGCVHAAGIHDAAARSAPAVAARVRGKLGRLFLEETSARNSLTSSTASSSSSAATDNDDRNHGLEGAAPESYCVWRPGAGSGSGGSSASASSSPRPPRKSGSTGSMARWRRISDLVVGRSHSDAREKFLFFATPSHEAAPSKDKPAKPKPTTPAAGGRKQPPPATVFDTVTAAHRIAYLAKGAGGGAVPVGTPRRTFLPYREELVGFFANVNGISRSHQHPF